MTPTRQLQPVAMVADGIHASAVAQLKYSAAMLDRLARPQRCAAVWAVLVIVFASVVLPSPSAPGWISDRWTGWLIAGIGAAVVLTGWESIGQRRVGWLLLLASALWFASNLAQVSSAWLASVGNRLTYTHRAAIIAAAVVASQVRLRWLGVGLLTAAYAVSMSTTVTQYRWWVVVPVILGLVAILGTRDRRSPSLVTLAIVALIGLAVVWPLLVHDRQMLLVARRAYPAELVLICALIGATALWSARRRYGVEDALLAILEGPSQQVGDRLSAILGDPTLRVEFRIDNGWVDELGRPMAEAGVDDEQTLTPIVAGSAGEVARIVHGSSFVFDRRLQESINHTAIVAAENARLRASVRSEIDGVAASTARVLAAADEAGRDLAGRLAAGAGRRLHNASVALNRLEEISEDDLPAALQRSVDDVSSDLAALSLGLGPTEVAAESFTDALSVLAGRSSTPTVVAAADVQLESSLASSLYFVCAEALANVDKHADATRAEIRVSTDNGVAHLMIADDGIGGADLGRGTGLRGLADRIDAVGGRFVVRSDEHGTTIDVVVPCRVDRSLSRS